MQEVIIFLIKYLKNVNLLVKEINSLTFTISDEVEKELSD